MQTVLAAAEAVLSPVTDSSQRLQASQYLQHHVFASPSAYAVAHEWLVKTTTATSEQEGHYYDSSSSSRALCLQLLYQKLHRDLVYGSDLTADLLALQTVLMQQQQQQQQQQHQQHQLLLQQQQTISLRCVAAIAVRTKQLSSTSRTSWPLLLWQHIPSELEQCQLRNVDLELTLEPHCVHVRTLILQALSNPHHQPTTTVALDTLQAWLPYMTLWNDHDLLNLVLQTLLLQHNMTHGCHLLEAALEQQPLTDPHALDLVIHHMQRLVLPNDDDDDDDAWHAVAVFITSLCHQCMSQLITQPFRLPILWKLQCCHSITIRSMVLDVWLCVADDDCDQQQQQKRHEDWKSALWKHLVPILLHSIQFQSDVDDDDDIEDEWIEHRLLVNDVWMAAYNVLQWEFLQGLAVMILENHQDWRQAEATWTALMAVSNQVFNNSNDDERTALVLWQLLTHAMAITTQASALTLATVKWLGAYAAAWEAMPMCTDAVIQQLLRHLVQVMMQSSSSDLTVAAAKAIRSILIACSKTLLSSTRTNGGNLQLRQLLETALSAQNEEAMVLIAEGCTRMIVQDEQLVRQGLVDLVDAVLQHASASWNHMMVDISASSDGTLTTETGHAAMESLGRLMHVLQVIIRFCDTTDSTSPNPPVAQILPSVWTFLEQVSLRACEHQYVLDKILAVHEQLLKTVPQLMISRFPVIMSFVVGVLDRSAHDSMNTMGFLARAVEVYGSTHVDSFGNLLNHVSELVFARLSSSSMEQVTEWVRTFFELAQRYIVFCTGGLVRCPQFTSIVTCAVQSLTACQGERESTRAALNFSAQLFGWRSLRLPMEAQHELEQVSRTLDELLAQYGGTITQCCISTIVGGPQSLWSACTDCLFAVLGCATSAIAVVPEGVDGSDVARQWMENARPDGSDSRVFAETASILLELARNGSKAKARMLLADFGKIQKGELGVDALVTYRLTA